MLAVNCLGPFLFTKLLHPLLESTAKSLPAGSVRVVWLGSLMIQIMAPKGGIDLDNLDYKKKFPDINVRYAVSKTGNLFICSEWAKRDAEKGIFHLVRKPIPTFLTTFIILTALLLQRLPTPATSRRLCSATCLRGNTIRL